MQYNCVYVYSTCHLVSQLELARLFVFSTEQKASSFVVHLTNFAILQRICRVVSFSMIFWSARHDRSDAELLHNEGRRANSRDFKVWSEYHSTIFEHWYSQRLSDYPTCWTFGDQREFIIVNERIFLRTSFVRNSEVGWPWVNFSAAYGD